MRVRLAEVQTRCGGSPLRCVEHLYEARDASDFHLIAHGAFARGDHDGLPVLLAPVCADQRPHLDGVGEQRASGMRLDAVDVEGRDVRVADGLHDGLLLRGAVGRGEARATAIVVHHGARNGADIRTAVIGDHASVHHLVLRAQRHRRDAIGADVAVRGGVEGEAAAAGAEPPGGALRRPPHGCQQEVRCDGASHGARRRAALPLQRLGAQVHCRGAGGALRVQGHAGPLEAQCEGEAPGADTQRAARGTEGTEVELFVRHVPLGVAAPDIDAATRVHQSVLPHAHGMKGRVAHLED
mmetsp:Transcript_105877/g.306249  ORF Transcript_105877/g.306249 Transcript_105877/m.306249 type:complete len:297 (-) Transcript_105877:933-1823(-)